MPPLVYLLEQALKNYHHSAQIGSGHQPTSERGIEAAGSHQAWHPPVVEFGTVLIFCCGESCWEEGEEMGWKKEVVVVQPESESSLLTEKL